MLRSACSNLHTLSVLINEKGRFAALFVSNCKKTVRLPELTVMTLQGTPDHESHDRFPLPRPLPHKWGGEIRESLTRLSH
ncbi:MAG: hypothetical protein CAPSK01_002309 [Candidatus Accumulibacter vicinus]|uniref:Uncharacterized protein n=1 Tax=Candidatus Accumulibacter vicinus TaxID=2954382 RepID=A0A084Y055_9PROT|nr:MAG: hypothetical protein CAPSK01_002309 [Candidatus Accumulibacter vicinus]